MHHLYALVPLRTAISPLRFFKIPLSPILRKSAFNFSKEPFPIPSLGVPRITTRNQSTATFKMSGLEVELTAPNGRKYIQPLGLFINGEWVKSSNGQKLSTINPT